MQYQLQDVPLNNQTYNLTFNFIFAKDILDKKILVKGSSLKEKNAYNNFLNEIVDVLYKVSNLKELGLEKDVLNDLPEQSLIELHNILSGKIGDLVPEKENEKSGIISSFDIKFNLVESENLKEIIIKNSTTLSARKMKVYRPKLQSVFNENPKEKDIKEYFETLAFIIKSETGLSNQDITALDLQNKLPYLSLASLSGFLTQSDEINLEKKTGNITSN